MKVIYRCRIDPETGGPFSSRKMAKILGLRAVNDPNEIRKYCEEVVQDNPDQAKQFRKGKQKVIGFFVKRVMDLTKNGAHPKLTVEILKEILLSEEEE